METKPIKQRNNFNEYLRTNRLLGERIKTFLPSVILTNSSVILFPLIDTLIVGHLIGNDALAAVSLSMPIIMICSILTRILSSGLSKTIAVYLGKQDTEGINRCFLANRMILIFGFILTLLIQIPVAYVVIGSYSFSGNDYSLVWAYFIGFMIGTPFDFVKSICVYNLRTFGKMKNLARLTIIVQCINLVGDVVLIRFLNLGIYGAGLATTISQIVFGIISLVLLFRHTDMNKFEKKPWIRELKIIFKTGFPAGLRVSLNSLQSWVLSVVVLYALDMNGLAVKAACSSCYSLISIFSRSVSEVMQPLAGVLHGAEDKVGSKNLLRISLITSVCSVLFLQTLIEIFPATVLNLYGIKSPDLNQIATLRIFCSFMFIGAGVNLIIDYFSSVEKSKLASLLTSLNGAPVFTPVLLLLSITLGGVYVWYAYLITALIACSAAIFFLQGYLRKELSTNKTHTNELYLSLYPKDGVKVSELLLQHFNANSDCPKATNRMSIFTEEITMYIRENNPEARVDISVKEKETAFSILIFDNGRHSDYAFELNNTELYDRLRVARLVSNDVFYQNVLGLNYVSASFAKE